ncbi:MAG: hypothetical protein KIT82_16155, partial [Bradyrhizobium sp.]|nr:hypothetical protein [Bradyrhizobium sp.]
GGVDLTFCKFAKGPEKLPDLKSCTCAGFAKSNRQICRLLQTLQICGLPANVRKLRRFSVVSKTRPWAGFDFRQICRRSPRSAKSRTCAGFKSATHCGFVRVGKFAAPPGQGTFFHILCR